MENFDTKHERRRECAPAIEAINSHVDLLSDQFTQVDFTSSSIADLHLSNTVDSPRFYNTNITRFHMIFKDLQMNNSVIEHVTKFVAFGNSFIKNSRLHKLSRGAIEIPENCTLLIQNANVHKMAKHSIIVRGELKLNNVAFAYLREDSIYIAEKARIEYKKTHFLEYGRPEFNGSQLLRPGSFGASNSSVEILRVVPLSALKNAQNFEENETCACSIGWMVTSIFLICLLIGLIIVLCIFPR